MALQGEGVRRYLESLRPLLNASQVAASLSEGSCYNQLMGNYINPAHVSLERVKEGVKEKVPSQVICSPGRSGVSLLCL